MGVDFKVKPSSAKQIPNTWRDNHTIRLKYRLVKMICMLVWIYKFIFHGIGLMIDITIVHNRELYKSKELSWQYTNKLQLYGYFNQCLLKSYSCASGNAQILNQKFFLNETRLVQKNVNLCIFKRSIRNNLSRVLMHLMLAFMVHTDRIHNCVSFWK